MDKIQSQDYFYQRPHQNFFNKLFYSEFMKRYNPLHDWTSYHPLYHVRLANWKGDAPHASWVDGIIDYTYNKYNIGSIGHFHMHENRKNKPFKSTTGADRTITRSTWIKPVYSYVYYPKGCLREINQYKSCVKTHKKEECFDQKINIMEVCPKWVLEALREKKRFAMRATLIDNQTYRRAMRVSEYNEGRNLKSIRKEVVSQPEIRSDGYWSDDRYNPTIYPSPDQNTNVNLGSKVVYNDVLGGNRIELAYQERTNYKSTPYQDIKEIAEERTFLNQPISFNGTEKK